jgi:hypothetical protein
MELTGGADCGALRGDEKSERVEEEIARGGSVRVERWVRLSENLENLENMLFYCRNKYICRKLKSRYQG